MLSDSEDADDVPLARLLQRRRTTNALKPPLKSETRAIVPATTNGKEGMATLNEEAECYIFTFLQFIPDRLRVEIVCRRWRRLSRSNVPVLELDLSQVAVQSLHRRDLSVMLERTSQRLERLVLPEITLVDAHVELIVQQRNLCVFRACRMKKKHIFDIVKRCFNLKTLELLDCRALTFSGWPRDAVALREVHLHGCNFITNQAVSTLIETCGNTLEKIFLMEATSLDSHIFRDIAIYASKVKEIAVTNCSSIRIRDFQALTEALWSSLRWLDLASCRGLTCFPDATCLPQLQVLILDKTKINDDGLRGISKVVPSLQYLSLQDCRAISDAGVTALANCGKSNGCTNLEIVDLKGTSVTDKSLHALNSHCSSIRLIRVDSCRSVSRTMRRKYNIIARQILVERRLNKSEHIFAERKLGEMAEFNKSSKESDEESDERSQSDQEADVIVVRRSYRRRR